jgi:diguanylate cyclase (GGDEF)-like protein
VGRFQRYCRPLSLLLIDIDHFNFINDTFGHDAGDQAIAHIAKLASESKRPPDILARIGGDEFVMLLPETDIEQACTVAERLREKVADCKIGAARSDMKITISIGAAAAKLCMSGIDAFLKEADGALYRAKSLGRDCVSAALPRTVRANLAAE